MTPVFSPGYISANITNNAPPPSSGPSVPGFSNVVSGTQYSTATTGTPYYYNIPVGTIVTFTITVVYSVITLTAQLNFIYVEGG
jgi:hypothetical protein